MEDSPDDVVNLLTANLDNQSEYTAAEDRGLLLQISINLDNLIGGQGVLTSKLRSEEKNIADYEDQLIALEERLQRSYQRYIEQFAAMESFVQRSKEMGKYLENQFKAMQNSND
jgi:flagellar capping protein FliD